MEPGGWHDRGLRCWASGGAGAAGRGGDLCALRLVSCPPVLPCGEAPSMEWCFCSQHPSTSIGTVMCVCMYVCVCVLDTHVTRKPLSYREVCVHVCMHLCVRAHVHVCLPNTHVMKPFSYKEVCVPMCASMCVCAQNLCGEEAIVLQGPDRSLSVESLVRCANETHFSPLKTYIYKLK